MLVRLPEIQANKTQKMLGSVKKSDARIFHRNKDDGEGGEEVEDYGVYTTAKVRIRNVRLEKQRKRGENDKNDFTFQN